MNQISGSGLLSKWWISGLIMLPSYLFLAVLVSKLNGLIWFISVVIGLFSIGQAYIYLVLKRPEILRHVSNKKLVSTIILAQVLLLLISYFLLK